VTDDDPEKALAAGLAQHPEDAWVVYRGIRDRFGRVVDFHHEWANAAADRNAGRALVGSTILDLYEPGEATLVPVLADLLRSGGFRQMEVDYGEEAEVREQLRGRTYLAFLAAVGGDLVACQYRDVTELRRAQRRLEHEAAHDELTGLPNRRLFAEHLDRALARLDRTGHALVVLLSDLDEFKMINDTYGHAAGDAVLRETGRRLKAATRPQDLVARYGGDEFVALCEDVSASGVEPLVQRVKNTVTGPWRLPTGETVTIRLSIGHAFAPPPLPSDGLLEQADRDLYANKVRRRAESG